VLFKKKDYMKVLKTLYVIGVLVLAAGIIGEVKCIIKAIDCNWEPVGKAEIVYTGASLTGLGCIVGYINIEDK
jgi:membrane-associated PAP2 superfamily phosphatase